MSDYGEIVERLMDGEVLAIDRKFKIVMVLDGITENPTKEYKNFFEYFTEMKGKNHYVWFDEGVIKVVEREGFWHKIRKWMRR